MTLSYSSKLFILLLYLYVYVRLTAWRCKMPARRTFSRPLVYYESTARVTSHISSSFIKLVAPRASRRRGSGRHWQAYTSAPSFARRFLTPRERSIHLGKKRLWEIEFEVHFRWDSQIHTSRFLNHNSITGLIVIIVITANSIMLFYLVIIFMLKFVLNLWISFLLFFISFSLNLSLHM